MLKSIVLALSILAVTPLAAQASEITLVPAVKLQIGERDQRGNYWDGGRWRDHSWWGEHYEWHDNHWRPHGRYDHHDNRHDDHHHDNGNHYGQRKHH